MKFTQVLFHQHIERGFRKLWQIKHKRVIPVTNAETVLSSMGFEIKDAAEVVTPKKEFVKHNIEVLAKRITFDESHPDWKDKTCLTYKDNNVLQEGIDQAKLLTKTVLLKDGLPEKVETLIQDIPEQLDEIIQRLVYNSTLYDAHQELLPKMKDPERPAWVFPRSYGITSLRKMRYISKKFVQFCESLSGPSISKNRSVVENGFTSICIEKDTDLIQLSLNMDLMLTSTSPLTPIANKEQGNECSISDIYPLHHTISLGQENIYKTDDIYPVDASSPWVNVHTIFIHHDAEKVKNLTELPVTNQQILARALLKSFTAAACCARQKFGAAVKELPEPLTVQCIQTDGQKYHFSVFQLNTLDINGVEGTRNFWWSSTPINLYTKAEYEIGRPAIVGYNGEVFKKFLAFYKNQ